MKFFTVAGEGISDVMLENEYMNSRSIGKLKIGDAHLFFRSGFKTYTLAGKDLERVYRRVMLVPARMCCGRGELAVEHIVLETGGSVAAQIQMPGERAAKAALEAIKAIAPDAQYRCPSGKEGE